MKEVVDKLNFITTTTTFCSVKDIKRIRRQAPYEEQIFPKDISDEEWLFEILKKILKFNNKKIKRHVIK